MDIPKSQYEHMRRVFESLTNDEIREFISDQDVIDLWYIEGVRVLEERGYLNLSQ